MPSAANDPVDEQGSVAPSTLTDASQWPTLPAIEPHEPRNLALLAVHQIVLRVGWIFKTESVIMPAFLDSVGPGAGWIRGFMPLLSRFGQSLPPVLCADWFRAARSKKRTLMYCVLLMSLPFAVLASLCLAGDRRFFGWMPLLFLVMYGLFFVFNGLYHVAFGTTQGKLIRPTRRGLLLLISTSTGTIPAVVMAWLLLGRWLALPGGGFGYQFAFTSVCFCLSGLIVLLLAEPLDGHRRRPVIPFGESLRETWQTLRADPNLRRLIVVAMLFGSGLIIFPHYQALARDELGLTGRHLMVWVIVQSISVGTLSLFVGPLADRLGNRLTLRVLVLGAAAAPLYAASLPHLPDGMGKQLFWLVFIPMGVFPLVLRIMANYALEICEPAEHPRYLSTVSLCLAVPFVLSPGVGWLVDVVGFAIVFYSVAGLIVLGGLMTFRLDEPRHHLAEPPPETIAPTGEE